MAVRQRVAHGDVEGELVADLPDQTDQTGNGFLLAEFLLVKDFRDRPHLPFRWPFDDGADKDIGAMVPGQRSLGIEMDRSPILPL
jgi:hypothetical protein